MTPALSVVIPTLGRSPALPQALARLRAQEGAPEFEVLVVADAAAPPYVSASLRAERPGASAARNAGLAAAQAPVVLFLGDDILASERLVAVHAAWHARLPDEHVAVLGHVRWARSLRRTAFMAWLERGIQTDYGAIDGDRAGWGHFYTTNVSVKRAFALSVGGFDEDIPFLYEDLDLARRLHDHGLDLRYAREAEGEHLHSQTLEDWQGRMEAIGRAERAFAAKHADFEPYFLRRLRRAAGAGGAPRPARGRAARLAAFVPERVPFLGPRVWASAEAYFAQQLWPAFKRGWDAGP
ncbi:MAG TPA: glycosyltransferase [Solirubrobacteraceae bacterium]|jgi:GT2 family glycosyltransferase